MIDSIVCAKCTINKSFYEFYDDKRNVTTGKAAYCIQCQRELRANNQSPFPKLTKNPKPNCKSQRDLENNQSPFQQLTKNQNPNPNRKKYEDVKEDYEKYSCTLLTSEEEYNMITNMRETCLKYQVPCCNKILESIYRNFTKKKDRAKCYKCLMNQTDFKQKMSDKNANRSNEFNVPHTIYQEYQGYSYLKDLLEKEFDIKKPTLYCKADFILKPKSEKNDLWLKVQLKTTGKINTYQYYFIMNNKNYDNHLLILMSIEDKKIWFLNGDISKGHKKIIVSTKNDKYKSNEITKENIIESTKKYYKDIKTFAEKDTIEFDNKNSQREYEYFKKREQKFLKLKYEYPEVEGTIHDLKINNYKVQDKIYSQVDKQNYKAYIQKQYKSKRIPYDKGDNDFYWIWLHDSDYFFLFPESVLIEQDIIKSEDDDIEKIYHDHIYINTKDNTNKYWYNSYKYNINDKGIAIKMYNRFKKIEK